jgi:hypothetical protein
VQAGADCNASARCDTFSFSLPRAALRLRIMCSMGNGTHAMSPALVIAGRYDVPLLGCLQWPRQGCGGAGSGRCRRECCRQGTTLSHFASPRCTATVNNVQATSLTLCRLALVIAVRSKGPSHSCHSWPREGCGGAGSGRCRRECCRQGTTLSHFRFPTLHCDCE